MTMQEASQILEAAFDMESACVRAQDAIYAQLTADQRAVVRQLPWPHSTYFLRAIAKRASGKHVPQEEIDRITNPLTVVAPGAPPNGETIVRS